MSIFMLKNKRKRLKKWLPLYLMAMPGLIYLVINNYIPMAGIVVAFKQYNVRNGIFGSKWVGLKNFEFLFRSSDSWEAIRNTVLYNAAFIVVNLCVAVLLAVLIHELHSQKARVVYQSSVLLPYLFSITIISYMVYAFLGTESGFLNHSVLQTLNIAPIKWYSTPRYWPWILIFVNLWKGTGYSCLIYIAALNGIDQELFEAADLDGAGKWKQFVHIMIPALIPSVITMVMLNVGKIFFSDFGLFYQVPMNSGVLISATQTMDTFVYRMLINVGNIGMSSAASVLQSIAGFCVVLLANGVVRLTSSENALF